MACSQLLGMAPPGLASSSEGSSDSGFLPLLPSERQSFSSPNASNKSCGPEVIGPDLTLNQSRGLGECADWVQAHPEGEAWVTSFRAHGWRAGWERIMCMVDCHKPKQIVAYRWLAEPLFLFAPDCCYSELHLTFPLLCSPRGPQLTLSSPLVLQMHRLRPSSFLKVTHSTIAVEAGLAPGRCPWWAEPESGVSLPDLSPGSAICQLWDCIHFLGLL